MSDALQNEDLPPLPTSPQELMRKLDDMGVEYTLYEHPPVFTVEESKQHTGHVPGTHCRNLFLRDKKKRNFLVVAPDETEIDLKKLDSVLDCGRLSFGSGDRLWEYLGIRQGSVNPFTIINDTDSQVNLILDADMMKAELVAYHPMDNAMTITLTPAGLLKFLAGIGREGAITDLKPAAP